ncbi:MAG: protein TolR [Rickettsiales bacterium]
MGMNSGYSDRKARRGGKHKAMAEINITPMVDVMLVLLIIFMVAAPLMTTGVSVDLPKTSSAPVTGQDEPIAVSVKSNGKVYVQKTAVKLGDLRDKLAAILGAKKETRIFVRGDKNVDYGRIMEVVSEINAAGFTKVALLTDMPERSK